MASLGSFGKRKPVLDFDFDWFGTTIRVNPVASDLIEIEFLGKAADIDLDGVDLTAELTADTMAKMTSAARAATDASVGSVRRLIHPDDWDLFWKTAIDHGQNLADLLEVQKAVTAAITEATSGFPTGQPSASPGGPATTPESSADGSSSPAAATPSLPAGQTTSDRALTMLRGRPDLQEFVVMSEEFERQKAARAG